MPSAVKAQSPNHWITREFPNATHYLVCLVCLRSVHVQIEKKKKLTSIIYGQRKNKHRNKVLISIKCRGQRKCDLIWKEACCQVKMRSSWMSVGLQSNACCPYKEEQTHRDTDTGTRLCDDGGRDRRDAATSQGRPRRHAREHPILEVFRGG